MEHALLGLRKTAAARRLSVAAVSLALSAGAASAESRDDDQGRGYVDGSGFAELADDASTLVEISIGRSLLGPLSRGLARKNEKLGELLSQLRSIQVVVVEVDGDDADRAREMMHEMGERLRRDGWDVLARVREDDDHVAVWVMTDDDEIDGLTVMVSDGGKKSTEAVFVNIAGRLNLELIGELGMGLNLPGLQEALGEIDWEAMQDADAGKREDRGGRTR